MGFLSRVLGSRGRRHATKTTKKGRGNTKNLRTALDRISRSLTRNSRSVDGKKLVAVYHHGTCTVKHRSRKAASTCRRTY
jgi:hypothetical protein